MKQPLFYKIVTILTIVFCFPCLLILVPGLTNSSNLWVINVIGLGYPLLLAIVVCLLIFWSFKRSKWLLVPLLALLISVKQITVLLPFRLTSSFSEEKKLQSFRVLSWNVSRWDERNKEKRGGVSYRSLMMDYIENSGADILCFQEFFECNEPKWFAANIPELQKRGYPYYFFAPSSVLQDGKLQYGLCIFSKHPMQKSDTVFVSKGVHSEGMIYSDIRISDKIIRIFTANLESAGINKSDYSTGGNIRFSRSLIYKLKNSYTLRNLQAEQCAQAINQSPYPAIICADLDDVPNSYAYFKIKSQKNDAFLRKGVGLGRTFRYISPTLRIDYIFADNILKTEQFKADALPYSDHYPLISDFVFKQ